MTLSYVDQVASTVVDINGNAQTEIKVPVGQYWNIFTTHIGTIRQSYQPNPLPICQLFVGSQNSYDITNLVDSTAKGHNDSTSILSSIIIQPGQSIQAKWTLAFTGDTCFVHVWGISSDEPPNIGIIPTIHGTKFVGSPVVIISDNTALGSTIPVSEQSLSMFANQPPLHIDTGALANNAVVNILPNQISVQGTWKLHTLHLNILGANGGTLDVEDTNNNKMDTFIWTVATAVGAMAIPADRDYKGAFIPGFAGLQLRNTTGSTQRWLGSITYSI